MQKLNTQAALLMDDETFRRTMARSLNQIMDALAMGVEWWQRRSKKYQRC